MAVLRPDQTQLTFAAEASPGADQDHISADATYNQTTFVTVQANPGDLSMTVTSAANFVVGDILVIGGGNGNDEAFPATGATKSIVQTEVRKLEHKDGNIIFFDRPLGFTHHINDGSSVNYVARLSTTIDLANNSKYITYVPGVYETVDTPDFTPVIEPRYFLGTNAKRNFSVAYAGQHSYTGALNGIMLLNGWPLRFPIGVEIPKTFGAVYSLANMAAESFLGDTWIKTGSTTHGLTTSDHIIVEFVSTPTLLTTATEIRKIKSVVGSNAWVELDTPLRYAHASGALLRRWTTSSTNYVEHHIVERTDLDSISMHLHMRDSAENAANDFDRRWIGGKVGAMSISGEEGGLVTVNWDSLVFQDMLHNQARHAGTTRYDPTGTIVEGGTSVEPNMPGYAMMNDIVQADVQFPTTQPYYFSEGIVSLFGTGGAPTEFARIRSFAIIINNNVDPRYYITQRFGDHRGPSEIREQRREYSMTCTVALPDTKGASDNTIDNATSIFKELMLEGRYNTTDMRGFNISLKFTRESSRFGAGTDDAMYIDIPGPEMGKTSFETAGTPNTTGSSLGEQGAFLRSAPHTIMTEAPFQVACDFVFRNIAIVVRDNMPVYP